MNEFEIELKQEFLQESSDLIAEAEGAFLRLESDHDPTLLDQIFRLAHNLKGTAGAVGFNDLVGLTHCAETLILCLKEGKVQIDDYVVSVLLEFNDKVQEIVEGLKENLEATFDTSAIEERLTVAIEGGPKQTTEENISVGEIHAPTEEEPVFEQNSQTDQPEDDAPFISEAALEALREDGCCDDDILKELEEAFKAQSEKRPQVENIVPQEAPPVVKEEILPPREKVSQEKTSVGENESIRVALSRINKLNNMVGELVILQTVLDQRRFVNIQDELSNKSIGQMAKIFKEVQEIAMSMRMVPLKTTFQKMARIVRDTSKKLGKDVELHLVGEKTEVDKTVLEGLADPLVHIVRNAIDHGLEPKEEREAAGKSGKGNVEIMAFHEGSNLIIQVTDDGGGIDVEKIKAKAVAKNIIPANAELSEKEILDFIFHPGFSTKENVTDVSGRGVGMDVVKTNINKLGGEVHVMSKPGIGSSFRIVLPLTLAIIDAMVARCSDRRYIIPLSQVNELVRPGEHQRQTRTGLGQCMVLRDEVIPLFNLKETLAHGKSDQGQDKDIAIIVRNGGLTFGVIVDDVINQQQVVIKTVGEEIAQRGIIGSSILGDGKAVFIVDLFELYATSLKKRTRSIQSTPSKAA